MAADFSSGGLVSTGRTPPQMNCRLIGPWLFLIFFSATEKSKNNTTPVRSLSVPASAGKHGGATSRFHGFSTDIAATAPTEQVLETRIAALAHLLKEAREGLNNYTEVGLLAADLSATRERLAQSRRS